MIVPERQVGLRDLIRHIVDGVSKDQQPIAVDDVTDEAYDQLEEDLISYMRTAPEEERRSFVQIIKICVRDPRSRDKAIEAMRSGVKQASAIFSLIATASKP